MMKFKSKKRKAPQWFIESESVRFEIESELAGMIGVSCEWFKDKSFHQIIEYAEELDKSGRKILNRADKQRISFLVKYLGDLGEYRWSKFRYENLDSEWGTAEFLNFDPDTSFITIRKHPLKAFEEEISKIFKKIEKKTGGKVKMLREDL